MRLSREMMYAGMAWYKKELTIPENWTGKCIRLMMERTKPTHVWVDTVLIGSNTDLLTPQYYDLSTKLTPGKHIITILVNNGNGSVPEGLSNSHAWMEHTQSNWNGILGKFSLEASNTTHFENIQVYPDVEKKKVLVKVKIYNTEGNSEKITISLQAKAWNTEVNHKVSPI